MIILIILIILIAIICGILAYQRVDREGFDLGPNTELSTCPLQSKAYLAKNGDTLCCETSLSPEGTCAKPLCALASRNDIPSCKALLDKANQKSASICPPSLPNYYTDGKETTGCTDGALNNERTGPISASSKICKVYSDKPVKIDGKMTSYTLNDVRLDSCAVQRRSELDKTNMKALLGSAFIDVMTVGGRGTSDSDYEVVVNHISFKQKGGTAIQNMVCHSRDTLIFLVSHMSLDDRRIFSTEAGRKAYIDLINEGLAYDDCSLLKAIDVDKSMTIEMFAEKTKKFEETHPNMYK
jgi:hypothetical protein